MTSSSAERPNCDTSGQEAGPLLLRDLSHWPRSLLLKRLTCQSDIDRGRRAEGDGSRRSVSLSSLLLPGSAPPDRGRGGPGKVTSEAAEKSRRALVHDKDILKRSAE
ncbi:unnamed protein product [Pleuronectes platessa]|uniref:Uncharacterized protein n=1 Tax=Pleuronectes platessa TaxID=8262 RepID=A0A9N7ULP4_PLEPL|nr:unnamed protein product [Pleuronectes platessa]